MSSSAQDFPHDLVPPRCVSVLAQGRAVLRSAAGDQVLRLHWCAWLSSAHPDLSLCSACALPGGMTASFWPLLMPCGIQRARAGFAAAGLRLCCLTLYISHFAFPISPPDCSTWPSSYPTKSQLTLARIPAGTDMLIFVLFTAVSNPAFDYIIFWGYSLLTSLFTLGWKLS